MERQISRRRKPTVAAGTSSIRPISNSKSSLQSKDDKTKSTWTKSMLPVFVGLFIITLSLFLLLAQSSLDSGGLQAVSRPQHAEDPVQDLLANFELHPERHIYRPPMTHHLEWQITAGVQRPDGVSKKVYLINGTVLHHCQVRSMLIVSSPHR
jgi:hypothetical protein